MSSCQLKVIQYECITVNTFLALAELCGLLWLVCCVMFDMFGVTQLNNALTLDELTDKVKLKNWFTELIQVA